MKLFCQWLGGVRFIISRFKLPYLPRYSIMNIFDFYLFYLPKFLLTFYLDLKGEAVSGLQTFSAVGLD